MFSRPELQVLDLEYRFPDGDVLFSDINISISRGETVVIYGGNGSGKSTLLKCIAGIESCSKGEIIQSASGELRTKNIGLVMQNPEHQMIAPTVEEELALGLEFRGIERTMIQKRVDEEIHRFSLEQIRFASPEKLSGGQMQRVALAAILAVDTDFLLLDEPDSLLDAPSRREFLNAVKAIKKNHGILWTCVDSARLPDADHYFHLDSGILIPTTSKAILVELEDRES